MDLNTLLHACAATDPIVEQITDDHLALPTPCDNGTSAPS